VGNNPINDVDPLGLMSGLEMVLYGVGWGLAIVEPTPLGESAMAAISAARTGVAAANIACQMSDKLSDPNPVPKEIREAYEDIQIGYGKPRRDKDGKQKEYQAYELKQTKKSSNVWQGAKEWEVSGTNHRILQRKDGTWGFVREHNYSKPVPFPKPWY
jgi:hypothetical protein